MVAKLVRLLYNKFWKVFFASLFAMFFDLKHVEKPRIHN